MLTVVHHRTIYSPQYLKTPGTIYCSRYNKTTKSQLHTYKLYAKHSCITHMLIVRKWNHLVSNLVYAVQYSEECIDLYIGETKQQLNKWMAQHRSANLSGQDCLFTPEGESTFLWRKKRTYFGQAGQIVWKMGECLSHSGIQYLVIHDSCTMLTAFCSNILHSQLVRILILGSDIDIPAIVKRFLLKCHFNSCPLLLK